MASTVPAIPPAAAPSGHKRAERRFFLAYALAIAAAILAGFAPSFFLRGLVEPAVPLRPLRPEVVVHGLVATAFTLLLPLQAWLVTTGRIRLHMRLGNAGFALAALVALSAYVVAIGPYHEPPPPGATPAMVVILPVSDFLAMLVLLPLAWRWRKDAQAHKRLMVILACLLSGAAIFRLPLWQRDFAGIVVLHAALFATVLPLWAWDWLRDRRLHRATKVGSAILAVDLFGRLLWAPTAAWAALVEALPGYGWP